ncbi:MAG TPA: NmrA/HSCARG family protein, partial [Mycobacterium sp.]|nr:NmrA/HSCARG family protein [Mycobacterium sp.]
MTEKRIIAVVGATGSQGGGLVRAILADPDHEFDVRALSRNAQSGKARELAAAGADVVEADLDDEASLVRAFEGVYGAFIVTNYWVDRTPEEEARRTRAEMELQQAEAAVWATKAAGVAHVIWSTLEDTRPHFGDDNRVPTVDALYTVPHFDAKGEADELFTKYGVPTTFLRTAFFFEGFASGLGPVRDASGKLVLTLPMADQPLSGIAVEDIGKTALGIFKQGKALIGKTVSIAGDHLTGEEYAAALTEALGERVVYQPNSWDDFRKLPIPPAVEMANMFQFYAEDSKRFTGDRSLAAVRALNPQLQSFRDWLALHKNE